VAGWVGHTSTGAIIRLMLTWPVDLFAAGASEGLTETSRASTERASARTKSRPGLFWRSK
jgi:hypothetical protein